MFFDRSDDQHFEPNALSTFEDLIAGGDPLLKRVTQKSVSTRDTILSHVIKEMLQQKIAALHYDAINNYVLFAPTMFITLLSAIISIFGTSQVIHDEDQKVWFSISVACLQLVLSIL